MTGSAPGTDLPSSLCVGQNGSPLVNVARNLGVIFDSQLALKKQLNKLCQLAYLEIRRIGSIRQYLSSETNKTLVSSLALSLGSIIVMLSLLALFTFSLIKFRE